MRNRMLALVVALVLLGMTRLAAKSVPALAEPCETWRMVGQIGGPTQGVDVQGHYAYVGVGLRLVVLDISNPAMPIEVGSMTPFSYFVEDIVVSGTRAYVAAGGAGLHVVDVSEPTNPIGLGAWDSPGYAEGVAISGTLAFLADGSYGLRAVDVSDPRHPLPLGAAYGMNYAFDVAVSGKYVYVAAAGAGLLVADVSDPAHMVEAGGSDTPGYAYSVGISGAVAYVADGWEGLQVINVSNPLSPALRGSLDTLGWAMAVNVAGTTAFLADGENGLRLVDVSDPDRPRGIGAHEAGGMARDVAVSGNAALVADQWGGLRLIDVTDLSRPVQVGLYSPLADARRVTVSGTYAYVAAGHSGLRLVDVSDPRHPIEVGAYDIQGSYASSVAVSGTYAYLATYVYGPQGLHVLDVSDPAHPIRVGALILDTDGGYRDIALQGQTVYVANEWGLRLIDVSEPDAPTLLGFIPLAQQTATTGVAVSGTWAYVGNCADGLEIVDVSNPLNPVRVGGFDSPGSAEDVAVAGTQVFIGDAGSGLRIVDVSHPQAPVELGFYDTLGSAQSPAVSGSTVFVSDNGGGVQVLDVSDPSSPALVQSINTPGFAWDTALAGPYAYVADGHGGLLVLERAAQGTALDNGDNALWDSSSDSRRDTFSAPAMLSVPLVAVPARRASSTFGHRDSAALHAAALTVTSSLDSGPGTLRQTLLEARTGDTITFDPTIFSPTRPTTIVLDSPLPALTQGLVTIDGSNAGVILDGSALSKPPGAPGPEPDGLSISSDGNTVRGLQIVHFRIGVYIYGGQNNVIGGDRMQGSGPTGQGNVISENGVGIQIQEVAGSLALGNLIGTDASGTRAKGNGTGIVVYEATRTRIGGPSTGTRNIISGNKWAGVYLNGERTVANTVAGNYIGTDISGTKPLGNGDGGVAIGQGASSNVVGGRTPEERNVISGQIGGAGNGGIVITDPGTAHNAVIGNFVGTDASGTVALGNDNGVRIWMAGHNRIGGTADGERNVISGNGSGVTIMGAGKSDNVILGNYIGTDVTGAYTLPNYVGVNLQGSARRTIVGGMTAAERNVISGNEFGVWASEAGTEHNVVMGNWIGVDGRGAGRLGNNQDGVWLEHGALDNILQGNIIAYSGGHGVRITDCYHNILRRNAIHSNAGRGIDLGDDGNGVLPAPAIERTFRTTVSGTTCPECTVEVFSDDEDEGRVYEGTTVADATGRFELTTSGGLTGPFITATATDPEGNTSQFSSPRAVRENIYLAQVFKGW